MEATRYFLAIELVSWALRIVPSGNARAVLAVAQLKLCEEAGDKTVKRDG